MMLNLAWLLVPCRLVGLSIPQTSDLLRFFCRSIYKVYKKQKKSSEQQFSGWKYLVDVRGQNRVAILLVADESNSNSNNHSLQPSYVEEHFWMEAMFSIQMETNFSMLDTLKQMDYSNSTPKNS